MKINVLAILVILILLFSGCSNENEEFDLDEPELLVIAEAEATDFYIIRSDYGHDSEVKDAVRLRKALQEKSGAEFGISTDWEKNPIYEHEIIVGDTLREHDSMPEPLELGKTGYIIKEENGKIFIYGGGDEGTSLAVDYFISNFVDSETVTVPIGYEKIVYHQYAIPDFYIDMCKIDNSRTILTSGKTTSACEELRDTVYERTGIWLKITGDISDGVPAFVVSTEKSSVNGTHEITVSDGKIVFTSSATSGTDACIKLFIDEYLKGKSGRINFPADFRYLELGDYLIVNFPEE